MKFILQEDKFILNESSRFLLNECQVLAENIVLIEAHATAAQLVTDTNKIKTLLPELLRYLPTGIDKALSPDPALLDTIETSNTSCTEVLKLITTNPTLEKTIQEISERASSDPVAYSEEEIRTLQPLCYNIASNSNSIKDRLKGIKSRRGNFVEHLTILQERLSKLKQDIENLYSVAAKTYKYTLNKTSLELPVEKTFKLEATVEPKKSVSITFKAIGDAISVAKDGLIKALKVGKAKVIAVVDGEERRDINCLVTVKAGDISTTDGEDWKTKFASAVDKETVIEEFIYTTWPFGAAEEVLKIKAAVLQECAAYGFSATGTRVNPFINFISKVYLKKAYNVTPTAYNIIHNSVAAKKLTGKDLLGQGEMGQGNLVFCKAFYSLDSGAMKLYITKQYNLLKAAQKPDKFASTAEMAFNALYNLSNSVTGEAAKNSREMQLRPMVGIEQLEDKWTGTISDTDEKESKNKVANNAALIQQINTTDNAIKVLVVLAIKFSPKDEITAVVQSCKEAKELMTKTATPEEIRQLVASVERLYKIETITAAQALSLAKSILESDQFTLTRE